MVVFNYQKLKGRIKEICGSQDIFASHINMKPSTLSLKLNNKSEWKQREIIEACKVLKLQGKEISKYFFCKILEDSKDKS